MICSLIYCRCLSDHVAAGRAVELSLIEMRERLVDDRWIAVKPRWEQYRNHPVSFATAWQEGRGQSGISQIA